MWQLDHTLCFSINTVNLVFGFIDSPYDLLWRELWFETKGVGENVTYKHMPAGENGTGSRKLVKALIGLEDLRERVILARCSPRLLHRANVLRFGDGRANTIGRAEEAYSGGIMD